MEVDRRKTHVTLLDLGDSLCKITCVWGETETNRFVTADDVGHTLEGRYVCPFCGAVREQPDGTCARCTMESSPATRQATKSRIGPWYVLQTRNPAAPGMKFETLLAFVRKGRVRRSQSCADQPRTNSGVLPLT